MFVANKVIIEFPVLEKVLSVTTPVSITLLKPPTIPDPDQLVLTVTCPLTTTGSTVL